jgi:hypothetical protein
MLNLAHAELARLTTHTKPCCQALTLQLEEQHTDWHPLVIT